MLEVILVAVLSALVSAALACYWTRQVIVKQTRRNQQQHKDLLHGLIEATVGTTGETYFYALVRELCQFLSVDAVLLATCVDEEQQTYQTQAYWCDGGYIMNHAISLLDSPCGESGSFWYMENAASELFPGATLLTGQFKTSGFFAVKLQDSSGGHIGVLAGMSRQALHPAQSDVHVIKLFAVRAAAEMERKLALGATLMEKERAQISLHSIGDGVITTGNDGCIDYMNPVAEALTGWRFPPGHGAVAGGRTAPRRRAKRPGHSRPGTTHCLRENRVIAPKTDNVLISTRRRTLLHTGYRGTDGRWHRVAVSAWCWYSRMLPIRRRMQKMIVHQATHDPLTGLVNRIRIRRSGWIRPCNPPRTFENTHALLFLDLDQFKLVNDSCGPCGR